MNKTLTILITLSLLLIVSQAQQFQIIQTNLPIRSQVWVTNTGPAILVIPQVRLTNAACMMALNQLLTATNAQGQKYVTNQLSASSTIDIHFHYSPPNQTNLYPILIVTPSIH